MSEEVYIKVEAGVRYWEDAKINGVEDTEGTLTPLRQGSCWCPVIRLTDGQIMDWPQGTSADIHFKVCDDGEYWLMDKDKQLTAKWGGYYVPDDFLCPTSNGYGDYIIMKINSDGVIEGWKQPPIVWVQNPDDESQTAWLSVSQ